ncbi:molecular chaperone Hsp33 [Pilibacter termitis]|uniref:33 kDa chaperonin n=1 Tax=Pilibacter termitis TaxID=263852 RepID=A0A1T4L1B3_9ENTE|nr:Hsp33 family molecular chaperone HslO [Pilibacter termitis]SJZ48327.1 molecular chaperone Hsp33 [Pilibacter termitis]
MENYLVRAIYKDNSIRAFALKATDVIAEACIRHETWSASSVALGRLMLGTVLLGANLKGNDRITVKMQGNGSGGAIIAESNACGDVKGYIQNPNVDMKKTSTGEVIVVQATGNKGTFSVIKDMGLKTAYTGQIPFVTGEIGEEFTYYLTESEQIPSSVGVSVKLDEEDRVRQAGGFLVQVLPDAKSETIALIERRLQQMPAISEILKNGTPEDLLNHIFGEGDYKTFDKEEIRFHCDCSKDKFARGLKSIQKSELEEMIAQDHGCEAVCHFCNEKYQFSEEELKELL